MLVGIWFLSWLLQESGWNVEKNCLLVPILDTLHIPGAHVKETCLVLDYKI